MAHILQTLALGAFPALAIVAALKDATSYTIPNWISLSLVAAFGAAALTLGAPLPAAGLHLAVGAGALVAGMVMFARGWIGGGDAKLLAGCALWLGWPALQTFLMVTALAGGAFALGLLALRSARVRALTPAVPGWVGRLATPGEPAPYGVAIAIGALAAFPASDLVQLFQNSY
jgi:prepilin peptidase CpaA